MVQFNVRKRLTDLYRRQKSRFRNRNDVSRANKLSPAKETRGLSLGFATLCVVDLFGVFPIVALPAALIACGIKFIFIFLNKI